MDTAFSWKLEESLATHRHKPRTVKVYYNNCFAIYIYCSDCKQSLSKYVENLDNIECPIGVMDNTRQV